MGKLISDIVLSLLSWMVEEERERIKTAQMQGIAIAKEQERFKGKPVKYHSKATGKDKIIYDKVVSMLNDKYSVMEIHRKTGLARNTIYRISKENNS